MLSSSVLALSVAVLAPLVTATATPACNNNTQGFDSIKVNYLASLLCTDLSGASFANSNEQIYSSPWISIGFTKSTGTGCTLDTCKSDFTNLIDTCAGNSDKAWGIGTLDVGCGTINFTIFGDQQPSFVDGHATNTIGGPPAPSSTSSTSLSSSTSTSTTSSSSSSSSSILSPIVYSNTTITSSCSGSNLTASATGSVTGNYSLSVSASVTGKTATLSATGTATGTGLSPTISKSAGVKEAVVLGGGKGSAAALVVFVACFLGLLV